MSKLNVFEKLIKIIKAREIKLTVKPFKKYVQDGPIINFNIKFRKMFR
jgi:hypothetical protein